jgi:hypothetical protein
VTTLAAVSTSVAFAASPPARTASLQVREALANQGSGHRTASGQGRPEAASAHPSTASRPAHAADPSPKPSPAAYRSAAPAASTKPAPAPSHPAAAATRPFLMYDSLTPQDVPAGKIVAAYADGAHPDYPSQVTGARRVLWIDVTGMDPAASVLDIEPGCASASTAPGWVSSKLTARPHAVAILYTSISEWSQVQAAVSALPAWMKAKIRWWIADPTGSAHIVPGSDATQWYWGPSYDLSTALPRF